MDTYAADRLQLALVTSNGTLLSGGTGLTGNNNRTRIGWLTANNTLADSTDYEFVLTLDLANGMWDASINGVDSASGTFNTSHIKGFDRYQSNFQQFSTGDYIDIDEISVNVESNAGQTLLEPVTGYYTTIQDTTTILHDSLSLIHI